MRRGSLRATDPAIGEPEPKRGRVEGATSEPRNRRDGRQSLDHSALLTMLNVDPRATHPLYAVHQNPNCISLPIRPHALYLPHLAVSPRPRTCVVPIACSLAFRGYAFL